MQHFKRFCFVLHISIYRINTKNVMQTIPQIQNGQTEWNSLFKTDAFTMNETVRGDIFFEVVA